MSDNEYGLYVVRPDDIGPDEKYFLITAKWTLLYTKNDPPKQHKKVESLSKLPELAVEWLRETIREIQLEYLLENKGNILQFAKKFNERFEEELLREREAMRVEEEHGDKENVDKSGGV